MEFTALQTQDKSKILNAVQSVRKILSRHQNPPIEMMIEAGLVPVFVNLLDAKSEEELVIFSSTFVILGYKIIVVITIEIFSSYIQFEAAWALTNIAAGTSQQTKTVIEAGAVPKFAALLNSPFPHIVEQAVWAIGNIAGDGPEARDLVLSHGVMNYLLRLIEPEPSCPVCISLYYDFF